MDQANVTSARPAPPLRREVKSFSELQGVKEEEAHDERNPPVSPGKRWSPTKSSWLENAIKKPDSPKPKAAPQQPSWMSDLNRAKQQRGSVDLGKPRDFKEVSTAGLMRSPPMGGMIKSSSINGLSSEPSAHDSKSEASKNLSPPSHAQISSHAVGASKEPKPEPEPPIEPLTQDDVAPEEKPKQHMPATEKTVSMPRSPPQKTFDKPMGRRSPSVKPKPETPPKKDFTSNLRARKVSGAKETKDEPEFKNVFGKLKRTQTQNYKAPDELKDNIMRGKAGLNVTGGPKQTERKDEFKESILKKKEGMKAGLPSASTTIRSASSLIKDPSEPLPEALAKRQGLTRSGSSLSNHNSTIKNPTEVYDASKPKDSQVEQEPRAPMKTVSEPTPMKKDLMNGKLGSNFNTALAGIITRGPSPMANANDTGQNRPINVKALSPETDGNRSPPEGGAQLSHMTKGRARGPKRRLPKAADHSTASVLPSEKPQFRRAATPPTDKAQDFLPKVRNKEPLMKGSEIQPLANISNNHRKLSQPPSPRKPSTSLSLTGDTKEQPRDPVTKDIDMSTTSPTVKQSPTMTTDSPRPRKPSTSATLPLPVRTPKSPNPLRSPQAPSTSSIIHFEPELSNGDAVRPSVKDSTTTWPQSSSKQPNGVRSPIRLPTRKDEEAAREQAGLRSAAAEEPVGLGIETVKDKPQVPSPLHRNLPPSPASSPKSPKSPPLPAKKPATIASRVPSSNLTPQPPPWKSKTTLSPNSEASRVITDFFGGPPACNNKFNIDTPSIISARSSQDSFDKIKTLRKQIFEVAADGKLLPVPSHQEHILFEANLYLCTHVFGNTTGIRTTEVYLWCGDGVPTSAVEDAQIFCRKVARENNGKLIILKQGKETANFFQALGGIVVIRRGSSNKAGSPTSRAATYMLCGRRHVGQIAFDEVDFSSASLCRGFPYIVASPSGKLHVWKGSGSGADELGCAKLIGMDISMTGEIEEIEDGHEPDSFWQAFPDGERGSSDADATRHWQLKASSEKYANRLFTVEVEAPRPKSSSNFLWGRRGSAPSNEDDGAMTTLVHEINPFAQSDLDNEGIHVLDAFFEVHVLVPSNQNPCSPLSALPANSLRSMAYWSPQPRIGRSCRSAGWCLGGASQTA